MCRAVSEGGRRCVGTRQQYESKVKSLTELIENKKAVTQQLQRRMDDPKISGDKLSETKIRFVTEMEMMRKWEGHLEELKTHWDQSEEGIAGLKAEVARTLENHPQYVVLHARLEAAEKGRAEEQKRRREVNIRAHNLDNVMRAAGYSQDEIDKMRKLVIEAYSSKTTPSEKTLKTRFDNAQDKWDDVKPSGNAYKEHMENLRRIAGSYSTTPEKRMELIETAKAEFAVEKKTAELNFKNARGLYDTTASGRAELKTKLEDADKAGRLTAVSALRGRLVSAEKRYELIRRADNARGRIKRQLVSDAKARGEDTTNKVWNAVRTLTPVNGNGDPITAPDPSERRKYVKVNLTEKDYANIKSDFEKTASHKEFKSNAEYTKRLNEYISARVSTTNFKAYHTAPTVVEANQKVRTGSTPNHGRNTADASGAKRDIRIKVSVTQKQAQNLKAVAGHLENTPASIARRLALGGREDLFAIQNDRANDKHWRKMTSAAQEHLGEKVTKNFR